MKFNSFEEYGSAIGFNARGEPAKVKSRKCYKCGGEMRNIPGTNVFVCDGKNDKGEPCGNRVFSKP